MLRGIVAAVVLLSIDTYSQLVLTADVAHLHGEKLGTWVGLVRHQSTFFISTLEITKEDPVAASSTASFPHRCFLSLHGVTLKTSAALAALRGLRHGNRLC